MGKALKAGWVVLADGLVKRKVQAIEDTAQKELAQLQKDPTGSSLDKNVLNDLKKRKLASIS